MFPSLIRRKTFSKKTTEINKCNLIYKVYFSYPIKSVIKLVGKSEHRAQLILACEARGLNKFKFL